MSVLPLYMHDWIKDTYNTTIRALEFSFGDVLDGGTKSRVVKQMVDARDESKTSTNHVTQGFLNATERVSLKEQLMQDLVLGPILVKLKNIARPVR